MVTVAETGESRESVRVPLSKSVVFARVLRSI